MSKKAAAKKPAKAAKPAAKDSATSSKSLLVENRVFKPTAVSSYKPRFNGSQQKVVVFYSMFVRKVAVLAY